MTLTILDFQNHKTIIQEYTSSMMVEDYILNLLGHSNYQFMVSEELKLSLGFIDTTVSHINIRKGNEGCSFNDTIDNLNDTIKDAFALAEALRTDIDAGHIEEDNVYIDFELYNNFSQKYQ
jgi:hypothetical protein